jgi:putative ABC transport system permease protein
MIKNKKIQKISQLERPLAWAQLSHQKVRMGVAMGGIAFANVLIFMQLGFLQLFSGGATLLPGHLNGDLFLMDKDSKFIGASSFERNLLYQSAAFEGVMKAEPLYVRYGTWAYDKERVAFDARVFTYNPTVPAFDIPEINQQQAKIAEPFTVLFDQLSRAELGPVTTDFASKGQVESLLNSRRVTVTGIFPLGSSFFMGSGNMITSELTYTELFGSDALQEVSLGILYVQPGTNLMALKQGIEKQVPGIKTFTMAELKQNEIKFQDENPTGVIFGFGAMMGFVVGVAIVYQVLYSDISDHLSEYATLKAIGYSGRTLLIVIFQEAALLAVLGYIPGFLAAIGMYQLLTTLTKLELVMEIGLALNVFMITLVMCLISAAIASNKLRSADPADVF